MQEWKEETLSPKNILPEYLLFESLTHQSFGGSSLYDTPHMRRD